MVDERPLWRGEVRQLADLTADQIGFWRQLSAVRAELRSPFFSFEFACAVAAAGARSRVCLLYRNDEPAGFFPFQFASWIAQAIGAGERIGGALNDFCGVIIDASRHGPLTSGELLRCAGLSSFEADHLDEAQSRLGLTADTLSYGARIRLEGTSQEQYWAGVRAAHRSDYETLRRRERKIERHGGSVDFVFAHEEPAALLDCLVTEKRRQYVQTGNDDGLAARWKRSCLELIALHREGRCVPVLSALFLDGCWVALHLGFRADNVLHYYLPVYNPHFAELSPGLVLLAKMIRDAPTHAIDEIDLGEGLSRYKEVFATELYPVYRDVWYRPGLRDSPIAGICRRSGGGKACGGG